MDFLSHGMIDLLAGSIARMILPSVQSQLSRSVGNYFQAGGGGVIGLGGGGHGARGGNLSGLSAKLQQSATNLFSEAAGALQTLADRIGKSISGTSGTGKGSGVASRVSALRTPGSGAASSASSSSPANAGAASPGLLGRLSDWMARRQSGMSGGAGAGAGGASASQNLDWWRRGWGNRAGGAIGGAGGASGGASGASTLTQRLINRMTGGTSSKHSPAVRASRLKILAANRYNKAMRAVKASAAGQGKPGFNAYAHGMKIRAASVAKQKLGQATALHARATSIGAAASGRVASALAGVSRALPMLAKFAGPVAAGASMALAVAKLPFALARMNSNSLESQRHGARYSGELAAAFARLDTRNENRKAINARDTAGSTSWLIDEQNRLQNTLQPFQTRMQNAWNNVQAFGTKAMNGALGAVNEDINWRAAAIAEAEAAIREMRLPTLKGIQDIKKDMDEEAARKAKEDMNKFSMQMSDHLGGWSKAMENATHARRNNKPKRPLKPIP